MQIETQIIDIINNKLKNPIYQTIQLLNMKSILKASNFQKKDGVGVHMVILHFVYMLVMNKKISTFMKQSAYIDNNPIYNLDYLLGLQYRQ